MSALKSREMEADETETQIMGSVRDVVMSADSAVELAISTAKKQGYEKGRRVGFKFDPNRVGEIIDHNKNKTGFFSGDVFPVIVRWDCDGESLEYSTDSLVLLP